ncbi:hypothetical protein PL321_09495 [Caloramator sp. mosi_1]|uniref:hypothetical protein n=1 Tax=Caloramator sp. mosi_1 TaxID=3023090 RepID=UPI00236132CE|nr:hypothetical protein [Caloramator sp. mosi_1]WDC85488.1 hypothetical protein PL321_09495 [Caloramator sp. mosi_1]
MEVIKRDYNGCVIDVVEYDISDIKSEILRLKNNKQIAHNTSTEEILEILDLCAKNGWIETILRNT